MAEELDEEIEAFVQTIIKSLPVSDRRLEKILQEQKMDEICQCLYTYCIRAWPEKRRLPPDLKKYWPVKDEISVQGNLIMKGCRILVPSKMREDMLKRIHDIHMGITKCRERAKLSVWWPKIGEQIKEMEHRLTPTEPLIATLFPETPWDTVGADLFYLDGRWYLLVTDYFSRYREVALLDRLKTGSVIKHLKSIFSRHGIPRIVRSDNGPQFHVLNTSEFAQFAEKEGFVHITSSPHYTKSNGLIEASVKTIKNRLKKSEDPYSSLLAYRTTPLENGYSPSQLLMGRLLRTNLPIIPAFLSPKWPNLKEVREKENLQRSKQKYYHDRHHRVREQPPLGTGDRVWITDLKTDGVVRDKAHTPRSYEVATESGTIRRNRKHLIYSPTNCSNRESTAKETLHGEDETEQTEHVAEDPGVKVQRTRCGRRVVPPTRMNL